MGQKRDICLTFVSLGWYNRLVGRNKKVIPDNI